MENINLDKCFGCGKDNPIGLKLDITYVENKSHIEFEVGPYHCGYPGLMHGGLIGMLFDEAMFYAIKKVGIVTVTVSMTVDYISPGLEGHLLICEAEIEKQEGRRIDVIAEIKDADGGKLIAKAKGRFLEVDLNKVISK
jgi:uncharacterized protein (TIGR00369 family)